MVSRFAGRLLTSPLAFFVSGVVDFALLGVALARWRVRERRAGAGAGVSPPS